ncbi:hypothetical protein POSPLADRAFT_1038673, partial [Postia placenta MAD-698-R-SB12]
MLEVPLRFIKRTALALLLEVRKKTKSLAQAQYKGGGRVDAKWFQRKTCSPHQILDAAAHLIRSRYFDAASTAIQTR